MAYAVTAPPLLSTPTPLTKPQTDNSQSLLTIHNKLPTSFWDWSWLTAWTQFNHAVESFWSSTEPVIPQVYATGITIDASASHMAISVGGSLSSNSVSLTHSANALILIYLYADDGNTGSSSITCTYGGASVTKQVDLTMHDTDLGGGQPKYEGYVGYIYRTSSASETAICSFDASYASVLYVLSLTGTRTSNFLENGAASNDQQTSPAQCGGSYPCNQAMTSATISAGSTNRMVVWWGIMHLYVGGVAPPISYVSTTGGFTNQINRPDSSNSPNGDVWDSALDFDLTSSNVAATDTFQCANSCSNSVNGYFFGYIVGVLPLQQNAVTFTQSGLGADVSGSQNVITVDGTTYTKSQLPQTFSYDYGSTHTVFCVTPITGSTNVYDFTSWTNGNGLTSCSSGTFTTPSVASVTVTANYVARAPPPTLILTPNPVTLGMNVQITGSGYSAGSVGVLEVWADNTGICGGLVLSLPASTDGSGNLIPITISVTGVFSLWEDTVS